MQICHCTVDLLSNTELGKRLAQSDPTPKIVIEYPFVIFNSILPK